MNLTPQSESFEKLMDNISSIALLLAEAEAILIGSTSSSPDQTYALLQALEQATRELNDWRRSFKQNSVCYWAVPSTVHNPVDDTVSGKVFPFSIQFESLDIATPLILYSAAKLEVLETIQSLERTTTSQTTSNSANQESNELARFLCQSIEYCFRPEMGILGPQITCLAQWAMRRYFRQNNHERELAWCVNISNMRGPRFRSGVGLMLFGKGNDY